MKTRSKTWLRIGISVIALALVMRYVGTSSLLRVISRASPGVLVFGLLVFLAGHVVAGLKWRLLQGPGTGLTVLTTLRAHFAGVASNLMLPGVVGGDLVRVGAVFRQTGRPGAVALASVIDRIIDSISLVGLATIGLLVVRVPLADARRLLVVIVATGVAASAVMVGLLWYFKGRSRHKIVVQLYEAVDLMLQRPLAVLGAFALSLCVQTAFILINVQLGRAVGVDVPLAAWFMVWPLSKLVALAPVSVAGIGVREAAVVILMRPFTSSRDSVMASSLLWQGLLITGGFIGWGALSLACWEFSSRRVVQEARE
jgi:uncharacterized membrane protein YbhN (UPF0104 family)